MGHVGIDVDKTASQICLIAEGGELSLAARDSAAKHVAALACGAR